MPTLTRVSRYAASTVYDVQSVQSISVIVSAAELSYKFTMKTNRYLLRLLSTSFSHFQAKADSPYIVPVDEDAVVQRLLSMQGPDGSFGGSVGVTAVVIPALAGTSPQDIKNVQ